MKGNPFQRLVLPTALLLLLASLCLGALAAKAQDELAPTPTSTAIAAQTLSPQVISVQPNLVSNAGNTDLVITGMNFADGAVAVVEGFGALATTYISPNLLTAALPGGVPPKVYALTIINPDALATTLANALTITAPAPTPGPTSTPLPTNTPAPTAFVRPMLVVDSYGASAAQIVPSSDLDFEMTLANSGQIAATNIIVTFVSGDFAPRATGGVRAIGALQAGERSRFWQPLSAGKELAGKAIATLEVRASYTDANGTTYNETFALVFPVKPQPASGPPPTATPTPTPTPTSTPAPRLRPQLIITEYQVDVGQLEPGKNFELILTMQNQGSVDARRVTMIVGGGSGNSGVNAEGTPEVGGLAGASGSFTEFAPVGSSNVQSLGDLLRGQSLTAGQQLIVNTSTKPGAYPLKVSFVYSDDLNGSFVDDQVITLLVYRQPSVRFNFYAPPPPITAGEPAPLPLQLVNTGNNSVVLGTFEVTAGNAVLENSSVFIGTLEQGGFFPLDAMLIANEPGPLVLDLSVEFTNDFNQSVAITGTLEVNVMPAMVYEEPTDLPGENEVIPEPVPQPETFAQKVWRFILGMLGLSSRVPEPTQPALDLPPEGGVSPEGAPVMGAIGAGGP